MKTSFKYTKEFARDFKRLFKKYRSLKIDLENFKKRMFGVDLFQNINFAILCQRKGLKIIKARLFCRSLRRSSLRVIYAQSNNNKVDFISIDFIELYFKGDKEREDRERIKDYLNNL